VALAECDAAVLDAVADRAGVTVSDAVREWPCRADAAVAGVTVAEVVR
jgi:hypothetical protein